MAQVGCALAAHAVDVFVTILVVQQGTVAAGNGQVAFGVNAGGVLLFKLLDIDHRDYLYVYQLFLNTNNGKLAFIR